MAVVDLQEDKARAVADELASKGVRSIAVKADVTRAKDCQRWAPVLKPSSGGSWSLAAHLDAELSDFSLVQLLAVG